jgi:hypothetical protein
MTQTQSAVPANPVAETTRPIVVSTVVRDEARVMLERDGVDLMSQFESMLSRCVKCRHTDNYEAIGKIVEQTMRKSLDFGDAHLTGKSRTDLTRRVNRTNAFARELSTAISACSWDAVRRVFGHESVSEVDVLMVHNQLGNAAAVVAVTALGPVIETIGEKSRSGAEMLKTLKLLVAELKAAW